jgi:hypothetical protein
MDRQYHFDLLADYFQFYLQDEGAHGDLSNCWTEAAVERMLAVAPGTIGVGTVRNMTVPVDLELHNVEPELVLNAWDQVVECSLEVRSGRIVIAGCTDVFSDAPRITLPPGIYRVRVHYGGLNTLSEDGLEGADCYQLDLWPGRAMSPVVLKAR